MKKIKQDSKAKLETFAQAARLAALTQEEQIVWLIGPDRWQVTQRMRGDETREGYYATVFPDGRVCE